MSDQVDVQTFRMKTGTVRVLDDRIELLRSGVRGRFVQVVQGDSNARTWLVHAVLIGGMGWVGFTSFQEGDVVTAGLFGFGAAWFVYWLIRYRDFSMARVVARDATRRVQGERGLGAITRDRVVVWFEQGGRTRRRVIEMPDPVTQGGRGEMERAMSLLRDRGWPVDA